jgi:hypothetical protein
MEEEAISKEIGMDGGPPQEQKRQKRKAGRPPPCKDNKIMITTCPQTKMWMFQYEKGGNIPPEFRQKFIRRADAERHIKQYAK